MPALGRNRKEKPQTTLIFSKPYKTADIIRTFGKKNNRQRTIQEINAEFINHDYRVQEIDRNTNKITEMNKQQLFKLALPNYNTRSLKITMLTTGKINERKPREVFIVKTNEPNKVLRIQRADTAEDTAIEYRISSIAADFTFQISAGLTTRKKYFDIIPNNVKTANDVDNFLRRKYIELMEELGIDNINAYDADNIRVQVRNFKNELIGYDLAGSPNNYYLYKPNKYEVKAEELFNYIRVDTAETENCLINTLKFINSSLKNRKLKQEIIKIQYNFENGIIPDVGTLTAALESCNLNYKIYNYISGATLKNISNINRKYYSFVIYNNHLYYLCNEEYNKFIAKKDILSNELYIFEDKDIYFTKLDNLINNNIAVKVISIMHIDKKVVISSYKFNNIVYVYNYENEPQTIHNLCYLFNIPYTPFINKFNLIEKITTMNECKKSYFLYNHSAREYNYSTIEEEELDDIMTIDANLCYMNLLESLEKIPIIDSLTAKTGIYNNEEILDNYFYSITLNTREDANLFFKNDDIYSGLYLNNEYIKPIFNALMSAGHIRIVEFIEGQLIDNYYKGIIETLKSYVIKMENKNNERFLIKEIINIAIGKFNKISKPVKSKSNNYKLVYTKTQDNEIFNKEEHILNEDIKIVSNKTDELSFNLYNHKPLRILLLNYSQLNILKIIDNVGIKINDIKQINTDSVSFKDNSEAAKFKLTLEEVQNIYKVLIKQDEENIDITENEYINNNFINKDGFYTHNQYKKAIDRAIYKNNNPYKLDGFKLESKTKIINVNTFQPNNISFEKDILQCDITTYNKYAGIGKTYFIKNSLVKDNNNYIVLSPQHSQLLEYRENSIKCDTIAHYTYNNLMPDEELIIIDEFYNSSKKDIRKVISWSFSHNKKLVFLGDNNQLKSVDNDKDNAAINCEFIKNISKSGYYDHDENDINYRNNYTFDIYKYIINNNFDMKNTENIIKYINSKCDEGRQNIKYICYRNATKNKFNKEMLAKFNCYFNSSKISGDIPLICIKKVILNDELIYKKQEFLLKANNKEFKLFINDDKFYTISKRELLNSFEPSYCLTLNSIQGRTLDNYKFLTEDVYFLSSTCKYNISGALYVLLSRQKEALNKNKLSLNEFIYAVNLVQNVKKRAYIK
jgi:hypothetical protein